MNRFLTALNTVGVLTLGLLCGVQWQAHRRLNLQVSSLEKIRQEQQTALVDRDRYLHSRQADLERFREQLAMASNLGRESREKVRNLEKEIPHLTAQRDHLEANLRHWSNAVILRDQRLAEAEVQILQLAEERQALVQQYNQLVTNYDRVAAQVQTTQSTNAPANP